MKAARSKQSCSVVRERIVENLKNTMRPEINSNDFGFFLKLISRFEFDLRRCGNFFFGTVRIFGVFKVQSHTLWPYMCLCCGLFVPTQFQFECCGVCDDS